MIKKTGRGSGWNRYRGIKQSLEEKPRKISASQKFFNVVDGLIRYKDNEEGLKTLMLKMLDLEIPKEFNGIVRKNENSIALFLHVTNSYEKNKKGEEYERRSVLYVFHREGNEHKLYIKKLHPFEILDENGKVKELLRANEIKKIEELKRICSKNGQYEFLEVQVSMADNRKEKFYFLIK